MIMSVAAVGRIVFFCAVATVAVGANAAPTSLVKAAAKEAAKVATTLNGCVSRDDVRFAPSRWRPLVFLRKRHDEGRRLQIVGGLLPSANIAAQVGALDPEIVAVAFAGRSGRTVVVPASDLHIEPSNGTAIQRSGMCQ